MLLRYVGLFIFSSFCFGATDEATTQSLRNWESSDGRTMVAQLVDARDLDALVFTLQDGRTAAMPVSRLSEADAALARSLHDAGKTNQSKQDVVTVDRPDLPRKFVLNGVPMIKQSLNYCVPASAAMIANYHGLEIDQFQIARLSSANSENNLGTYARDMKMAMEKLGFVGEEVRWTETDEFLKDIVPEIRTALYESGPLYISFKAGIYGEMGHGCVVVGYDNRKEELLFYNPWGNEFELEYRQVAIQARGLVFIKPSDTVPVVTDEEIQFFKEKIPHLQGDLSWIYAALKEQDIKFELIWCSRYDNLYSWQFADDMARRDGRLILKLAFRRNPAVLIPNSPKGETTSFYFVTRPPGGGAQYAVHEISRDGWKGAELKTLSSLTREWPTLVKDNYNQTLTYWQLPLIELFL